MVENDILDACSRLSLRSEPIRRITQQFKFR